MRVDGEPQIRCHGIKLQVKFFACSSNLDTNLLSLEEVLDDSSFTELFCKNMVMTITERRERETCFLHCLLRNTVQLLLVETDS